MLALHDFGHLQQTRPVQLGRQQVLREALKGISLDTRYQKLLVPDLFVSSSSSFEFPSNLEKRATIRDPCLFLLAMAVSLIKRQSVPSGKQAEGQSSHSNLDRSKTPHSILCSLRQSF